MTKVSNQLYDKWEQSWKNNKEHNLTWVGKMMLKSKQKALKEVLNNIKPVNAVDVGCGLGYTLSVFKEAGIRAIGIDASSTAVEICQKGGLNAVQKKLEETDGQYDFVFSDGMLEHFLNFEPCAENLMKLSSCYVCVIQTDHGSFLGKTSIYIAELLRGSKNILEYNYRIRNFIDVFENHGFSLISEKKIFGGVFKILLFKKN